MTTSIRLWIAGITLAALFGLIYVSGSSQAAFQDTDMKGTVQQIGEAFKKGDKAGAKKLADTAAKNKDLVGEVGDFMHMFAKRDKKGFGVGSKALDNPAKDGIEIMIRELAKGPVLGGAKY